MQKENLGTETIESPSIEEANVENQPKTIQEKYFPEIADANASTESEKEILEEGGEETIVDESAGSEGKDDEVSGEEDATEAAEQEETEGEDHLNEENQEIDEENVVAFEEMQNHTFEIDGKRYSAEDIKSVFGQEKAAGTKSREASDKLKELDTMKEHLDNREAQIDTRQQASVASDAMLQIQAEGRDVNSLIQKARDEGDMYELAVQKDKLEVLGKQYDTAKVDVDAENQRQQAQQIANAEAGLKDRGLSYLLQDGPAAEAWNGYVNANLSEVEARTVAMVPSLAEMVEKARKWDKANTTKGTKVKLSGKTLKAGTNKPVSSKKTKAQQDRRGRMNTGKGTESDLNQTTDNIINKYFPKGQ